MTSPLTSLIESGTKLWLDSIDPDLTEKSRAMGATGATSNPIIVSGIIKSGRFDDRIGELISQGIDDESIAWSLTDHLVNKAQKVFLPIWDRAGGNDGYVSFELDPLLEDAELGPPHDQRVERYIELGKQWSAGHKNRMIKVPATPAGLDALEELAAAGVTLNVTLIFTDPQYIAAREAIWRGFQRRDNMDDAKSVYSIFVSRVDVYTTQHVTDLTDEAQGLVGIVNAKQMWASNQAYWADKGLPLQQEIIFASTGAKLAGDAPDKYVETFAGSDIQTNPPKTNDMIEAGGTTYSRMIEQMPPVDIVAEIAAKVDEVKMHQVLLSEGTAKFADPHKALISLIGQKRAALV